MPYTAAQLSAYYQSLTGFAPTGSDLILINASAQQNQQGSLSDTNALLAVFNSPGVVATFEAGVSVYTFFNTPVTGGGLSQGGIAFFNNYLNGAPPAGISNFNTENRYYNLAVSAASAGSAANTNFVNTYGSLTFAQTVASAYETIIGSSTVGQSAANAAIADITGRQAFFTQVANERAGGVNAGGAAGQQIALKAIVIGYILQEANKADVGTYAKAIDQFEASVAAGNAQYGANVLTTYSNNGSGFNSGFIALGASGLQQNFALTTGVDTFQPTSGNYQFVGVVNGSATAGNTASNPSTLQAGDQIRGSGGNNTLTIDAVGAVSDATGGALISGIQEIRIRTVADPQAGGATSATLDATLVPGVQQVNAFLARGPVTVNNLAQGTAVGIIGDGSVVSGQFTANFNGTATAATLNLASGTTPGTSATITGAAITTVGVNSNGGLNQLTNLVLPASATTLNIGSTSALTITGATTAAGVTTLTAAGSGAVNLGAAQIGSAVTNINTTGLTGTGALTATIGAPTTALTATLGAGSDNLTINGNLATGTNINTGAGTNSIRVNGNLVGTATIIGGAAADAITVTGTVSATSVINTSGGGDTIAVGNTAGSTITAGATLNGGGGATLVTNGANFQAVSTGAGFTTAQRASITGFSTVGISDALAGGSSYDINAIGAQNFTTVGVAGGTANLNANTGAVVTFVDNLGGFGGGNIQTNTGTLNINLAGATAAAQTNDVLNLGVTGATNNATLNVTTAGVETVNVTANRATGTAVGAATLTVNLTDAALRAITFGGNESFNYAPIAAHTALTSITSTSTGVATIDLTAISTFGAVSNGTATAPILVTTGSGADNIIVRDFVRITADGGNDLVTAQTVTTGQTYSTWTDAAAGDRVLLQGSTSNVAAANVAAKIVLASTAVFQDYLDAAARAATGANPNVVSSFDFNGNTFLVLDNSPTTNTFQNGTDNVIQLVGIHTVGSIAAGVVTLGS